MAKRKHKQTRQTPIAPDLAIRFKKLMVQPVRVHTIAEFPVKNINRLWRWDTLEDVTF